MKKNKSGSIVACFGMLIILGLLIILIYNGKNIMSSNSYAITFNGLTYQYLYLGNLDPVHQKMMKKYNLPSTITKDMLGEFVGYVNGTHERKPLNQEVSKLYYYKEIPDIDVLIMKDYNGDFGYVMSENIK